LLHRLFVALTVPAAADTTRTQQEDDPLQSVREEDAGVLPPLLEIRNLHTEFRTGAGVVPAVDGISYTVERGETVAIVGESGSGKTAGALSILRLIPNPPGRITQGEILFAGRDLLRLSDEEIRQVRGADIGMIFQEPMTSLNPVLTIGRQITETLEQHRGVDRAAAQKRAVDLLGLVGIADPGRRLKQYPHQLSGGMRQRIMIAIALACDPKLIIADEPTTALDVTIQAQILELMKQLTHRLDVALIIITHNLGVVARYANRVNVMYAGRIVESGRAAEIYHDPRHPYTMALLRSVPRLDRPRQARLDPVDGQPPDLTRLDGGCSFRPRCRFAVEACARTRPPLQPAGNEAHLAACFRGNEIAIEPAAQARQLQPESGLAAR
jgi:oligopeptide/dipeptide ABC transporter ATP-binding protein